MSAAFVDFKISCVRLFGPIELDEWDDPHWPAFDRYWPCEILDLEDQTVVIRWLDTEDYYDGYQLWHERFEECLTSVK